MKRIPVLFPFFLIALWAAGLVGCQNEGGQNKPDSKADSLWHAYDEFYENKEVPIRQKLQANQEMIDMLGPGPDSLRVKLLVDRIRIHRRAGAMDSTLHYTRDLLELGQQNRDTAVMADAHFRLGFYLRADGQQDSALGHYYRARDLYTSLRDSANAGIMSLNMANILNVQGNYQAAEDMAVEGLEFMETQGSDKYLAGLYNALATSTKELKNYEDALTWYDKALGLSPDSLDRLNIANNRAVVLLRQGKTQAARALLLELSQSPLLEASGNERTRARIIDNLGYAEFKSRMKDQAEEHLEEALALRQEIGYKAGQHVSALRLAEFYSEESPARAYEMALRALELSRELENPEDRLSSLGVLMETAPNPRPYALAFRSLSDSLQEARQRSKDGFAKIRYQSEKNRRDFLEARQEANARALELARSENRNLVLLGSILILLISGYFVYRFLKLRHSREQLKTVYQTEKRISKKVHDNLANDIFNIMSHVESEKGPAADGREDLLQHLDRVYRKSRDISRDSGDIPAGEAFEPALRSLVATYATPTVRIMTRGWDTIYWHELRPELQVHLYRVVQELLVNMKKHSGASLVLLEVSRSRKTLTLHYKDNGKGFQEDRPQSDGGLGNTENRIEAIGGSVTFDSESQGGAGITINIPV